MKFRSNENAVKSKTRSDLISRLKETEGLGKNHLQIAISAAEATKVQTFLEGKGLPWKRGITRLIDYGLSIETEEELETLRLERESENKQLSRKCAAMNFTVYQYAKENYSLTMLLNSMIKENQAYKQALKRNGINLEDELGEWDKATVEKFYQKYVFERRFL